VVKAIGQVVPVTGQDGRLAGQILGAAGMTSTIDAIVVAVGARLGEVVILTGDAADLERLAEGQTGVEVHAF
jgi:hypothetical protein